jgi:filamentous hemagglutinin
MLATIASGIAGGLAGNNTAAAGTGAQAGKNAADNNALAIVAAGNSAAAAGSGAVAGAVGQGSQYQANNTSDDLDMAGSCEGTREQCAVRDPSRDGTRGPGHTELPIAEQDPTGGKLVNPDQSGDQGPIDTGNNQPSGQGVTNTGNSDGNPDTGGNTTVTPIPEGPNQDDLAYLSEDNKYVPSPKHAAGGWGTPMDLSDSKAQEVLNNSIQGGKQRYGVADGKVYEFQPDNVGGWHGYPIPGNEAPPKVLRELLSRGDISKAEYNKMIKGKL